MGLKTIIFTKYNLWSCQKKTRCSNLIRKPCSKRLALGLFYNAISASGSRDSVVGTATRYGPPGVRVAAGERIFSLVQNLPERFWRPIHLLFSGYRGSLPGIKRLTCEFDHSPPPSAEVKNEWSCASAPAICLHGIHRTRSRFFAFAFDFNFRGYLDLILLHMYGNSSVNQ